VHTCLRLLTRESVGWPTLRTDSVTERRTERLYQRGTSIHKRPTVDQSLTARISDAIGLMLLSQLGHSQVDVTAVAPDKHRGRFEDELGLFTLTPLEVEGLNDMPNPLAGVKYERDARRIGL
jgi:hypothetical protein